LKAQGVLLFVRFTFAALPKHTTSQRTAKMSDVKEAVKLTPEQFELAKSVMRDDVMDCFGKNQQEAFKALIALVEPIASGTHVIVPVEPSSVMHEAGGQAAQWFDEQTAKKVVQRRSLWDTTYVAMISARDK
jgi:hypothetical protein